MLEWLVKIGKVLGVCGPALGVCGTGYVYFDGPIPASRQYVLAQNGDLKTRLIELQLQQNKSSRDASRADQFIRQQEYQKDPTNFAVKQRLDQINDDLEAIKNEHEKLVREKEQR